MMKTKKTRELAGVIVAVMGVCTIGAVACQVDVISGDDGEGGQGGSPTTVVTSSTTGNAVTAGGMTTTAGTTVAGTTAYAVGSTAGSGGCPPTPQWPSDCATVGATAAGSGTGLPLKFCQWNQQDCGPNPAIAIECDEATGLCTCTGSGESCSCNWDIPPEGGYCGTPCCGGTPDTF